MRNNTFALHALLLAAAMAVAPFQSHAQKESLRAEVGKPLQEAQKLVAGKQYKQALALVDQAQAVGELTDYESFVVTQMRGAVLANAGDALGAAKAYEKVYAAKRLPPQEQVKIAESLAGTYLRAKNYPKAIEWIGEYRQAGGTRAETLGLLPQAYYFAGDYPAAIREAGEAVSAAEKHGGKPDETLLKLLASSYQKTGDMDGYTATLERLVRHYPSQAYWADLIQRTVAKPGFNRALELDMYRLMRATELMTSANDYMEMAQLALHDGLPGEAKAIVDEAYARGIFGAGAEAQREQRLKALVEKRYADDLAAIAQTDAQVAAAATGEPLLSTGLAYVTYGQTDKGLAMMEQGIAKGGLKNADLAQLHLGYAYRLAGKADKARAALAKVKGADGSANFARYWTLLLAH